MSSFAERLPGLSKHWTILRDSWRRQNETEKDFTPSSEHEFLPAALEIIEKPASPGLRALLLSLCGLFVIALGWSIIGKVDVVAVAQGKAVPAGSAKVIQPLEIGTVRVIHVRNGQYVREGQLLIELDPTTADADAAQSDQTLRSAQLARARNAAILNYLGSGTLDYTPPSDLSADEAHAERQLIASSVAEYEAQLASLRQQRAQRQADLAGATAEIAKLDEAMPYTEQQLEARRELTERGFYAKLKLLEYEQYATEQRRTRDVRHAAAQQARAGIGALDAEIRRLRETFRRTAAGSLTDANQRAGLAGEEVRKANRRREARELRAPVDGVVQQLVVNTVGGVVQPAQSLMVIVPCRAVASGEPDPNSCTSAVEVDAFVQNKDVGFIHAGQRVAVKLEAFNFTDYGMIDGEVESISRDAIDLGARAEGTDGNPAAAPGTLAYMARIKLLCGQDIPDRSPLCDRVQPGMSAQAEIKTGERQIIQYLLSPIAKTTSEAGRER